MIEQNATMTSLVTPQLLDYDFGSRVKAFSTMRKGGYSEGLFGAFNINCYCGDEEAAIRKNRAALCNLLGIREDCLFMPHQVHETVITAIDAPFLKLSDAEQHEQLEGVDALMTNETGVCIGVSTADCIPVLLYDPEHHAACAIHAGWRGTVKRIAEKAVARMRDTYGTHPSHLMAQIGPGISLDSFEVGDEVYDTFLQAGFHMPAISRRERKWHIDLPACNRLQLLDMGVAEHHIRDARICTYRRCDDFFSARRLGVRSGRIFTAIFLS